MSKSEFDREDIFLTALFSVTTAVMVIGTMLLSKDVYDYAVAGIGIIGMGGCLVRSIICLFHNRKLNLKEADS